MLIDLAACPKQLLHGKEDKKKVTDRPNYILRKDNTGDPKVNLEYA